MALKIRKAGETRRRSASYGGQRRRNGGNRGSRGNQGTRPYGKLRAKQTYTWKVRHSASYRACDKPCMLIRPHGIRTHPRCQELKPKGKIQKSKLKSKATFDFLRPPKRAYAVTFIILPAVGQAGSLTSPTKTSDKSYPYSRTRR
jgi:hypothetical protein